MAGELKLNSDGAFNMERKDGGWGFILRDDQGRAICSGAGRGAFLLDAFHAELLVCLAGLQEVAKLGITRIILEVDATMLKDAILTDDYRLTPTGGVITEIKQLIGAEFMSFTVSVCKRVCNSVAHALAVSGCNLPSGCYKTWEGVPQDVEALVTSDLAGSDEY
jgi:hypothetical protein